MDRILVWRGKYDDKYFNANTPENLENSARMILRELLNLGHVVDPGVFVLSDEEQNILDFVNNHDLNDVPEEIRDEAFRKSKSILRDEEQYAQYKDEFEKIKLIVRGVKTDVTAWSILQNRNGDEYEDYELATVIHPDSRRKAQDNENT